MAELVAETQETTIEIGGNPILLRTRDADFSQMLRKRYENYLAANSQPGSEFNVDVVSNGRITSRRDVRVRLHSEKWTIERGDLLAEWSPSAGEGRIRQSSNLYAIDTALRIINSLWLAQRDSFLVHAASAVRNGRAFLFVGVSGAGKTTISRLAPPDVSILTDEISCVRRHPHGYFAYGTPFAGELGRPGANIVAPLAAIYLLAKAPNNSLQQLEPAEVTEKLMRNILFFAREERLVRQVFESACHLASVVPAYRLEFVPDATVWDFLR